MSESRLIVGLGNPGKTYTKTRHNLGFLVVQYLTASQKIKLKTSSFTKAQIARDNIQGVQTVFMLPLTYMNLSGVAVKQVCQRENILPENVLVVSDDIHLDFGKLRVRSGGRDGGHNGLGSIIEHLGTEDVPRLRMGVGRPSHRGDQVDYVLEQFSEEESAVLKDFVREAAECSLVWLRDGISNAMEQFNRRKENGTERET